MNFLPHSSTFLSGFLPGFAIVLGLAACTVATPHSGKDGLETALPVEGAADSFRSPTVHGELELGSPVGAELTADEQFHTWTFELTGPASVSFTTDGDDPSLDTVMYLYEWNGERWGRYRYRNDDYDGLLFSQLNKDLESGLFRVLVKGYSGSELGHFDVLSECDGEGCSAPVEIGCFLGVELRDLRMATQFRTISTRVATLASDFIGIESEQFVQAAQVTYPWVRTVEEGLDEADAGGINIEVYQNVSDGLIFRVLEYGAGDNSYGAVFQAERTDYVAQIRDGFLEECFDSPTVVEGVYFTAAEAASTVRYANEASESEMRAASVYGRAIPNLLATRPFADVHAVGATPWVGPATLRDLKDAAAAGCSTTPLASLAMTSIDPAPLSASCSGVGTNCGIESVIRLDVASCGHSFDELVAAASIAGVDFETFQGEYNMGRPGLEGRAIFRAGLLDAMDDEVRGLGGALTRLRARTFESEVPCHNCTQFETAAVVEYQDAGIAYVVLGNFGYDS